MKRLIVTADDFGMSLEVNEAVEQAHREGILTCASLVVAGEAAEDAVRRAKRMPSLGVGLHLAMFGAPSCADGPTPLGERPVRTGIAMMLSARARAAARREVEAQFEAYRRTGLPLGHLDGHWHCHEHPVLLAMAIEMGLAQGLKGLRVPYEPFGFSREASRGLRVRAGMGTRLVHAFGHWPLAAEMRRQAIRARLAMNDRFFGKNDAGAIDAPLLAQMIQALPEGTTELGLHPASSTWTGPHAPPPDWRQASELAALTDPTIREAIDAEAIVLSRWSDLP